MIFFLHLIARYCLFGEWLWCTHCVSYDKLPDFFIAFDILDKAANEFVCHAKFLDMVGDRFQVVPLLKKYTVCKFFPLFIFFLFLSFFLSLYFFYSFFLLYFIFLLSFDLFLTL
jgi:hypothetical protein